MLFFFGGGGLVIVLEGWVGRKKEKGLVGYLDEMLKDGCEVFVGAVVEGVDGLGALDRERLVVCFGLYLLQQNSPGTSISFPTAP